MEFEPGALKAIARGAEGSMRDALSLLDQVLAFGGGRALEAEARALLGTLDRRHVGAILTALAASDGHALMKCVAALDERAPDYHQALGELAGALQRMALLQALPDLETDPDDEDGELAALAARFAPEDLQLCYQIAIMSRRDLDYAPDARGGFEMALLRMLAFKPASVVDSGRVAPAGAATPHRCGVGPAGRRRLRPPRARVTGRRWWPRSTCRVRRVSSRTTVSSPVAAATCCVCGSTGRARCSGGRSSSRSSRRP